MTLKASHFFAIVLTIGPLYWGYGNRKLTDRIDNAFDKGATQYTETIKSDLCLGLKVGFFKSKHQSEFKIYDRHGNLHTEKFDKSLIGGCRRHRPYLATWKKIEESSYK